MKEVNCHYSTENGFCRGFDYETAIRWELIRQAVNENKLIPEIEDQP